MPVFPRWNLGQTCSQAAGQLPITTAPPVWLAASPAQQQGNLCPCPKQRSPEWTVASFKQWNREVPLSPKCSACHPVILISWPQCSEERPQCDQDPWGITAKCFLCFFLCVEFKAWPLWVEFNQVISQIPQWGNKSSTAKAYCFHFKKVKMLFSLYSIQLNEVGRGEGG